MIAVERLKDLVSTDAYTAVEKLLICLAVDPPRPMHVKDLRALAVDAGLRQAAGWNVSRILASASGQAVRTGRGWELTTPGMKRVSELVGRGASAPAQVVATGLRHHLSNMTVAQSKSFLEEAVLCFEARLYRAAIVFSWVGAVSVLYDHVVTNRLSDFNAESSRRDNHWKIARTRDDLTRMKEHDFLQVLAALSIIGKNVKQDLEGCLQLRNACGHPNSLVVGESKAAAHIESLLLNVFSRF